MPWPDSSVAHLLTTEKPDKLADRIGTVTDQPLDHRDGDQQQRELPTAAGIGREDSRSR